MGWDERIELGDTGNVLENGALKDRNGEPIIRKMCPKCYRWKVVPGEACPNCGHKEEASE